MAMDLWRLRPYTPATLARGADRLLDETFGTFFGGSANGGSTANPQQSLPVNVWETEEAYQAVFLAPGLDEASLDVTVHEDTLTVQGDLRLNEPEGARSVWQEFGTAKVRRALRLGSQIDPGRVEALYRNGLLLVTLPKAQHARPRQIQVQVTPAPQAPAAPEVEAPRA